MADVYRGAEVVALVAVRVRSLAFWVTFSLACAAAPRSITLACLGAAEATILFFTWCAAAVVRGVAILVPATNIQAAALCEVGCAITVGCAAGGAERNICREIAQANQTSLAVISILVDLSLAVVPRTRIARSGATAAILRGHAGAAYFQLVATSAGAEPIGWIRGALGVCGALVRAEPLGALLISDQADGRIVAGTEVVIVAEVTRDRIVSSATIL